MPFTISIKLTADDCRPSALYCQLTAEQIATGEPIAFGGEPLAVPAPISASFNKAKLPDSVHKRGLFRLLPVAAANRVGRVQR